MNTLWDIFDRVGHALVRSAVERHDSIARILDRVTEQSRAWWFMFVVLVILSLAIDVWQAVIAVPLFFLIRKWHHLTPTFPSSFTIGLYEAFMWQRLLVLAVNIALLFFDRETALDHMVVCIVTVLWWIVAGYLIVDLYKPPRPPREKREPVPVAKPAYEGLIT